MIKEKQSPRIPKELILLIGLSLLTPFVSVVSKQTLPEQWATYVTLGTGGIAFLGALWFVLTMVCGFCNRRRSDYFEVTIAQEEGTGFIHVVVRLKRKERDKFAISMRSVSGAVDEKNAAIKVDYDLPWQLDSTRTMKECEIQRGEEKRANFVEAKYPNFSAYSTTSFDNSTNKVIPFTLDFADKSANPEDRRITCKLFIYGLTTGAQCLVVKLGYDSNRDVVCEKEITQRRSPAWKARHDFSEIG